MGGWTVGQLVFLGLAVVLLFYRKRPFFQTPNRADRRRTFRRVRIANWTPEPPAYNAGSRDGETD